MTVSLDGNDDDQRDFRWKIEKINETTIRILIEPNGFVGFRRIICHWNDKIESGSRIDLIFEGFLLIDFHWKFQRFSSRVDSDRTGLIRLKENCREFDRLYVECQFIAPIIARALKNRSTPIFHFVDLDRRFVKFISKKNSFSITLIRWRFLGYANSVKLIPNEAENEITFRFAPVPRGTLEVKPILPINMTVILFGSKSYVFHIDAGRNLFFFHRKQRWIVFPVFSSNNSSEFYIKRN